MSIDSSSRFSQFLNINIPDTDRIVFGVATVQKLCDHIDGIRLHAHTYSLIHNLTHGSFKPANVLEFVYEHELHGLNIHVDDGGEHSLARSTPKLKTYIQWLTLRTANQRANRDFLVF